tara:strand:+ start:627 stop:2912 length:2286 start_codon:yes stop_codon:yes gene_type:complete
MLAASVFRLFAPVFYECRLSDALASIPLASSILALLLGQACLFCLLCVASVSLNVYLESLDYRYTKTGYGSVAFDTPLLAPIQVTRDDLQIYPDSKTPSPDTTLPAPEQENTTDNEHKTTATIPNQKPTTNFFRDRAGRRLLLRGINLGGDAKCPVDSPTHKTLRETPTHPVSFVGRPFALEDAPVHFSRLQAYGLTLARLVVTWEAVEHAGPRQYDEAYLTYLTALVRIGARYNISFIIDAHQDVWSRYTGGAGAPRWTLEKVGFDVDALHDSAAAFTHAGFLAEHGLTQSFPDMTWPCNHHRLACGTMFTLFFGGRDFAPNFVIEGVNIQDYLQSHFIRAMTRVARALRGEANVLGFDAFNEPNLGMIGWRDLARPSQFLRQGAAPTWFQSFQLGAGLSVAVDTYEPALVHAGTVVLNKHHVSAWRRGVCCLWLEYGVWGVRDGEVTLLQPDYFCWRHLSEGTKVGVDAVRDYFVPFAQRFQSAIQVVDPQYVVFLHKPCDFETTRIAGFAAGAEFTEGKLAWSPHWYDLVPVVTKSFRSWLGVARDQGWALPLVFGRKGLRREYARQLRLLADEASTVGPGVPLLVGELGCPFDMKCDDSERADRQIDALDASLGAAEEALVSCCIWNYTATNSSRHGDGWNGEDFSVFCSEGAQGADCVFAGGRALPAVIRPYVLRWPGTPRRMEFCVRTREFVFEFEGDEGVEAPLVAFVPRYQYPTAPRIQVSSGEYKLDVQGQTLVFWPGGSPGPHWGRVLGCD